MVKNPLANEGDMGSSPGSGRSPRGENGNALLILAWRIPWTEEPAGYSPWGRRESDRTEHACVHALWRKILLTVNPQQV